MILRGENLRLRPIPFMELKPHGFMLPLSTVAAVCIYNVTGLARDIALARVTLTLLPPPSTFLMTLFLKRSMLAKPVMP